MKPDPTLRQTVLLFHSACGGIESDDFAPYQLPDGENFQWRIKPLSATRIGRIDLDIRGGRRTLDLRPDRPLTILPTLRCFGPRIPDADAMRPLSPACGCFSCDRIQCLQSACHSFV